ncbi:MAG: ATP-binding cassette domain-containing protein [Actinobacteria bacterium]|nr:MAG: ATP-binding cassette domain-containing protein [Actinomycetota bacterium]
MLEVLGLTKRYGDNTALSAVTVAIEPGEILGLLGPNGAGKTTLVSIVAGLRRADAGTVRVCDVDVAVDPSGARRCLGLAPQELGMYPILTVARRTSASSPRWPGFGAGRCANASPRWPRPSTSSSSWIGRLGSCQAVRSGGCTPPSPWFTARRCCCSTSRQLASTCRPGLT